LSLAIWPVELFPDTLIEWSTLATLLAVALLPSLTVTLRSRDESGSRQSHYTGGMSPEQPQRVAVVGGGISGLAAAHRLLELSQPSGRTVDVTLYDAAPRLGGVFGTEEVDGYRLELGADMFITDKPWALDLCRRLGLEDRLIAPDPKYRKSLILSNGRPVPTPDAFNLMVPGRLWPVLTTPLLSPFGKLRLMCEPFVPRRDPALGDESLAGFVQRRLGRETLERIVQPLVGGIYTGDPAKLSLAATLPRFQTMEREQGSLTRGMWRNRKDTTAAKPDGRANGVSGARYGLFMSLKGGMGELQRALVERVQAHARCVTGTAVMAVEQAASAPGPRFRVRTVLGVEEYDALILATPAYRSGELVAAWQPALAAELQAIEYASSVLVVTGHRLGDIAHPLDAYGLVVPARERRMILAVSIQSRKFPDTAPEGRVVLRTFIGGALQPGLAAKSDDDLRAIVSASLEDIFGVRGDPEVTRIVRYQRAMPQYNLGHLDRVERIEALARSIPGLYLCGNAYRGVGLPDCIHSGENAAAAAFG
jgi:oxygen-dependent protoporphyrinogen oxidase